MRIAIYGAGGYQAGLVHGELDRRGVETVLVGRSAGHRRARAEDHDALVTAFQDCAAVVNCAGPFTDTGHAVIRAAVAAGCHYVDTAGEQAYVASVFDEVDAAGVTVVPAATDSCVPTDLLAHLMGPMDVLTVSHVITGGAVLLAVLSGRHCARSTRSQRVAWSTTTAHGTRERPGARQCSSPTRRSPRPWPGSRWSRS